jgi:F-box interacting protein
VEILRRVPVRSLCRFKCVSRSWRNLISDPAHRKKLPHTLVGFLYDSWNGERYPSSAHHFTNVTGKGAPFIFPDFSFLPVPRDEVLLLDSCHGLLLCRCLVPGPYKSDGLPPFHYAVCNPATKKWVMLPDGSWPSGEVRTARLGFDPAISSHFHVVEYVVDDGDYVIGVEIYSSKTGAWSFKENEWGTDRMLYQSARSVFLNGFMHMLTYAHGIVVVDMEGKTWRSIPVPAEDDFGCIHLTQGRLCFLSADAADYSKLSIWTLEDHGTHEWTLKHSVRTLFLFGQKNIQRFDLDYTVITFHPECNLIYFVYGSDNTLMAYEMDRKEVRVIRNLGHDSSDPYLPYVPLFSELLADER